MQWHRRVVAAAGLERRVDVGADVGDAVVGVDARPRPVLLEAAQRAAGRVGVDVADLLVHLGGGAEVAVVAAAGLPEVGEVGTAAVVGDVAEDRGVEFPPAGDDLAGEGTLQVVQDASDGAGFAWCCRV